MTPSVPSASAACLPASADEWNRSKPTIGQCYGPTTAYLADQAALQEPGMRLRDVVVGAGDDCQTIEEIFVCRADMNSKSGGHVVGLANISELTMRTVRVGTCQHIDAGTCCLAVAQIGRAHV